MPSFNPRLPGGRRRSRSGGWCAIDVVSIHAFRGEGDAAPGTNDTSISPRVSIHAFRGEGDEFCASCGWVKCAVSIHAFRGEGDASRRGTPTGCKSFNPRLPGGRRRVAGVRVRHPCCAFQSTPSGGKATVGWFVQFRSHDKFQSTPSGGKATWRLSATRRSISFQSTPSGGKATWVRSIAPFYPDVSIHAFRGEGDAPIGASSRVPASFNPRLPGGRRRLLFFH